MKIIKTEYKIIKGNGEDWSELKFRSIQKTSTYEGFFGIVYRKSEIVLVGPRTNYISEHPSWDEDRKEIEEGLKTMLKLYRNYDGYCK